MNTKLNVLSTELKMDRQLGASISPLRIAQSNRRSHTMEPSLKKNFEIVIDKERNTMKIIPTYTRSQLESNLNEDSAISALQIESREEEDSGSPASMQACLLEELKLKTKLTLHPMRFESDEETEPDSTTSIRSNQNLRRSYPPEEAKEMEPDSSTSINFHNETHELVSLENENDTIEIDIDETEEVQIDFSNYDLIEISVEIIKNSNSQQ